MSFPWGCRGDPCGRPCGPIWVVRCKDTGEGAPYRRDGLAPTSTCTEVCQTRPSVSGARQRRGLPVPDIAPLKLDEATIGAVGNGHHAVVGAHFTNGPVLQEHDPVRRIRSNRSGVLARGSSSASAICWIFEIRRSGEHPSVWEEKGSSLYSVTNVTRLGGRIFYYGIRKTADPDAHDANAMYLSVPSEATRRLDAFCRVVGASSGDLERAGGVAGERSLPSVFRTKTGGQPGAEPRAGLKRTARRDRYLEPD